MKTISGGRVIWITGLSGSGKTTLAENLKKPIESNNKKAVILDGDAVRKTICNDLKYSLKDREENIRRVSEIAKLLSDNGLDVITAFISPTVKIRNLARKIIGNEVFKEVYLSTPIEICESRDPKGLYAKARSGEIENFTGISSAYEPSLNPLITINTDNHSQDETARIVFQLLNR